jgi:UDP-glucuronate 4-epimerase
MSIEQNANSERPILVTGVAGFIGAKTAEFLLAEGKVVIGVDNFNDYYDVRLKYYRINSLLGRLEKPLDLPTLSTSSTGLATANSADGQFHFYHLDIENRQLLEALFDLHIFGSVLNLAARAGVWHSMENPHIYERTNTAGTLNLLEAMRSREVNKMVLASTSSLYAGQKMPYVETQPVNNPISPYAATKKAAELIAHSYHYLYGLDISVVRYFTVFGPCGRPDMSMFRFIEWILKEKPIELFEVINLGGGNNPVNINWLVNQFEIALNKRAFIKHLPLHKTNLKSSWADIAKAKRLLDWEPQMTLLDGIQKTVEWHQANRDLLNQIRL